MTEPSPGLAPASIDWQRPFARLAGLHALGMAGEALLALGLAGSLFFNVDPAEGRDRVLLGLLLTVAPFAVVGPLIGPAIDRVRGGHRAVIIASMGLRAAVALLMVLAAADDSLLLFPEAFVMLVLAKTYQVARAAVVPRLVGAPGLVEANSKLQIVGGLSGIVAAAPGGLFLLAGPEWVLGLCALAFVVATPAALGVPRQRVADAPAGPAERAELRAPGIRLAATSMATLRGVVGFSTLLIAFALRGEVPPPAERMARFVLDHVDLPSGTKVLEPAGEYPKWWFGVVVALGVLGSLSGAALAPRLRRVVAEERILLGALGVAAAGGLVGVLAGGLTGMAVMAWCVALAASSGKQAFDAVVQRDAPDANLGRSFARFESRFQLCWVFGALVPTAVQLPVALGAVAVFVAPLVAAVSYRVGGFRARTPPDGANDTPLEALGHGGAPGDQGSRSG